MKCSRTLLVAIPLLLSAAMIGCSSKIRVMMRDSVTHEPIVGAQVIAGEATIPQFLFNSHDEGITNKDGIVILYIAEAKFLMFHISPYYSLESRKKSAMLWTMSFDHPARYGNTDWVQLGREVLSNIDPKIEFKIEKYDENDGQNQSQGNR